MSSPIVHIVHHVDTEGPLCEPLSELFDRIEKTLHVPVELAPTRENLRLLQSPDHVFRDPDTDALLKKIIAPHLLQFKGSWAAVEEMLDRILQPEYRNRFRDSFGAGWVYNWHVLEHVGFDTNPRHRAMGYLTVFNFYRDKLKATGSTRDSVQWHFHPVPFNRAAHISATSYLNSCRELLQVMCRRLLDANWFPVVNRAGFHTVRPDSNWWLEQWMPFDASSQAMETEGEAFADNVNGRFGDWRGAPHDWSLYHPDLYDWRRKGTMKRTIARCLNMNTRFRNITGAEFEKAFQLAERTGRDVYVGFTNHDFREMSVEMEMVFGLLHRAAAKFPGIPFKFNDTIAAFQACLGYGREEVQRDALDLQLKLDGPTLSVSVVRGELFGAQPFLALKTRTGTYHTDNFDFGPPGSGVYYYTLDALTFEPGQLAELAVAANDRFGNTCIRRLRLS
jgi:hypothetical protein